MASHWDQHVRLLGDYFVQNLGRHAIIETMPDGSIVRRNRAAFLRIDETTQVSLPSRPDSEMDTLSGRRVAAVGVLREARPTGSRVIARPNPVPYLADITSVEPVDS